ncbi:B-box zinc finger family protein [Rhynchospora pubera]|uniref:B-box zinc finger family protein n=1 Tax=Rhynchospora pubera TaxID=906938 RepID=A0AAV8C610_9POAL|nr:B-box zinc finger family protein [Rhynchospora pubera]
MKVLCNACEAAEAVVMCCADEAALCWACDERVHAANKLAGKHQRIPLISSSSSSSSSSIAGARGGPSCSVPKCDICQEASGYFFCLEDRALLCRNCDISIHSANPYVSSHQRFLLTGVQVGLEPSDNAKVPSTSSNQPNRNSNPAPNKSIERTLEVPPQTKSFPKNASISGQATWDGSLATITGMAAPTNSLLEWPELCEQQFIIKRSSNGGVNPNQGGRDGNGMTAKAVPVGNILGGTTPDWPLDEFFGFNGFNGGFGFPEHGSSKADSGKLGSSESSSLYRSNDEEMEAMGYLGQVPEISSWTVPEMPSPPTDSGLHWQRNLHHVPDILSGSPQKYLTSSDRLKSRRRYH